MPDQPINLYAAGALAAAWAVWTAWPKVSAWFASRKVPVSEDATPQVSAAFDVLFGSCNGNTAMRDSLITAQSEYRRGGGTHET